MKMSPIARNFYLGVVLAGVLAYLSFLGHQGWKWYEDFRDRKAVMANEDSEVARPLSGAIVRYASGHNGTLPKEVPLAELFAPAPLPPLLDDPQVRVKWNNAIGSFQQCKGGRYVILWVENDARKFYAAALVSDGERCQPEIIPKLEVAGLNGTAAVLR